MELLDGRALAFEIRERIAEEVRQLRGARGITPGLAVIVVGDDPASRTYVKMKAEACHKAGIYSITHEMPEHIDQASILETIRMINQNPNIDGLLIQLPLPPHISTSALLEAIDPRKDVDGFHPFNVGRLMIGLPGFIPATPLGVMRLLAHYGVELQGKNCVVVGASNIVGKPMASLLLNAHATVEVCHIHTQNLAEHTRRADVVVVGVGKPGLITEDMIKEGSVVIDIGINKNQEGVIVGDVDFVRVAPKCSLITPVPGGVGPMTIAMLLQNTLEAAQRRLA